LSSIRSDVQLLVLGVWIVSVLLVILVALAVYRELFKD